MVSSRVSISSSAIYSTPSCTNHESRITLRFQSGPANHVSSTLSPAILPTSAAAKPRRSRAKSALFGGEMGTEMYAPLIAQAAALLKPDGIVALELGHNSAEHVSRLLTAPVWSDLSLTNDLAGIRRVASARRNAPDSGEIVR